jgi:hypothetical protein
VTASEDREETSLEGWRPAPGEAPLAAVVDKAFDYRGDVTVLRRDGSEVVGYVYNRDTTALCLQMFRASDGASVAIPYADVLTIHFTGRDPATGKSYQAWLRRKAAGAGV